MALRSTDLFLVGRGATSYKFSAESLGNYYKSSFLPLSGTLPDAPVTGDIEFQNGKKILFGSNGNGLTIKNDFWGGLFYTDQLQFEFGRNGLKAGVNLQMKIGQPASTEFDRNRITFLGDPQHMYDAVNKKYVDDKYDELDLDNLQLDGYLPLTGGVMTGLLVNNEISVGPYPTPRLGVEPLATEELTPTLYVNTGSLTADVAGLGTELNDLGGWYHETALKPNDALAQSVTRVEFDGEESESGYAYIYTHNYDNDGYYYSFSLQTDVRDWTKVVGTDIKGVGGRFFGIISTRLADGTVRYLSMTNKGVCWKDNDFRGDGWTQTTNYSSGYTYQVQHAAVNGLLVYGGQNSPATYFSTDGGVTGIFTDFANGERYNVPVALGNGLLFTETGLSSGSKDKISYTEDGVNWTYIKFSDIVDDSELDGTTISGSDCSPTKIGDYYYIAASSKIVLRSKTPLDTTSYEKLPEVPYSLTGIHALDENLIVLLMNRRNYHPLAVVNGDWNNLQEFDFQTAQTPKGGRTNHFISDDDEFMYLRDDYSFIKIQNDDFTFSGTGEQHIYWNNEQLATVADLRSVYHYAKENFDQDETILADKLEDAPSDGESYVRKDGEWAQETEFDDSHLLPLAGGELTGNLTLNGLDGDGKSLKISQGVVEVAKEAKFKIYSDEFEFVGGASNNLKKITVKAGSGAALFRLTRGYNQSHSSIEWYGGFTTDTSLVTKGYVQNQIANLGDILTFKGALDFVNITAPASPSVGDVYASNVSGTPDASWGLTDDVVAGELYGRGESGWSLIGGASIDLTGYATETYVDVQTAFRVPLNISTLEELPD